MDAKKDRMEALLEVDNIICRLNLNLGVVKYKWDDYLYSKLPTSTLPKTVKNSEIINTILIKSWETQGSDDPIIRKKDNKSEPLMTNNCQWVVDVLFQELEHCRQHETCCWILSRPRKTKRSCCTFILEAWQCDQMWRFTRQVALFQSSWRAKFLGGGCPPKSKKVAIFHFGDFY